MSRLGKKQLDLLGGIGGVFTCLVVPSKLSETLRRRGLMASVETGTDGFIGITPAGYRAIADALESGVLVRPPLKKWGKGNPLNTLTDKAGGP